MLESNPLAEWYQEHLMNTEKEDYSNPNIDYEKMDRLMQSKLRGGKYMLITFNNNYFFLLTFILKYGILKV